MSAKTKRVKLGKRKPVKEKCYNDKLCEQLADAIETLTHSGNKTLNQTLLDKVKTICNQSENYIKESYNMMMEHLKENHAEVRFSTMQIIDEMFRKSNCFRELIICSINEMVELTISKVLPPPNWVAKELRDLTVKNLYHWKTNFGEEDIRLNIVYDYLSRTEEEAFSILGITDTPTRASQEENIRHQQNINQIKLKQVLAEIKEKEYDIKSSITSLSNCINLLLPHPDDFFIVSEEEEVCGSAQNSTESAEDLSDSDSDEAPDDTGLREVGIHSVNHSVELNFIPSSVVFIKETQDNVDIIKSARETAKLIKNKYVPNVKSWMETVLKYCENKEEHNKIVDMKGELDDVMFKYNRMIFITDEDVSSDSDLEEVELNPIQSEIHEIRKGYETPEPDKATEAAGRKEKLLAVAPKRPFDVDLYHWEDDKLPVPTLIANSTEGHRFWMGANSSIDEIPVPDGSASLRTRVIEFTGSFSPVTHSCRVRLPSGKLCPRRDRHKCPFHGVIVPRDEKGNCINPQDAIRMQKLAEKRQQEKPDWQDPKLLADIKKTTGIDLKMPEKGKRKRKERKHPGLTDLKNLENTARNRLQRKLFKRTSMKKVAAVLDGLDQRRFKDKFGDQFNYFFNS